jgi:hypothetical protein
MSARAARTRLALVAVGTALALLLPIMVVLITADGARGVLFIFGPPVAVAVWQVWRMAVVYAREPETHNGPGGFGWLVLASTLPYVVGEILWPSPPQQCALLLLPAFATALALALLVVLPLQIWIRHRARGASNPHA